MFEQIQTFKGFNNVSDPMRLDMSWLAQADNVNITDTGALTKREGYTLNRAGGFKSAFGTFDHQRSYLATSTEIQTFDGLVITTLASTAPIHWTEVNNNVLFSNGIDAGIILPDNTVLPWRWDVPTPPNLAPVTGTLPAGLYRVLCTYSMADSRETGASDPVELELIDGQALQISNIPQLAGYATNVYICPANSTVFSLYRTTVQTALTWNFSPDELGRDFLNDKCDPLPLGVECIQVWRGRVYVSLYMPTDDQTAIWFSDPLAGHLFNLAESFIIVPGHVHMLAPHDAALVIGTDARVYAYDGTKLDQLADYGVTPGQHWVADSERILFWSLRGLCAFAPFSNLTERQVSVAPGVRAGGCLVRTGGQKRYLSVLQQGGSPFNAL